MKRLAMALLWMGLVCGCAAPVPTPSTVAWTDRVPSAAPAVVANQPVVARDSNSIMLLSISPRGAAVGVAYAYDMPHCGINSPVDVDGSFWDAVNIDPESVDFDGQPGTFRLTAATTALFTRTDGGALDLVRHVGAKEFGFCM